MRHGQMGKRIMSDSQVQLNEAISWCVRPWIWVNVLATIVWPAWGGGNCICIPAPRHMELCFSHIVPGHQQHNGAAVSFLSSGNTAPGDCQYFHTPSSNRAVLNAEFGFVMLHPPLVPALPSLLFEARTPHQTSTRPRMMNPSYAANKQQLQASLPSILTSGVLCIAFTSNHCHHDTVTCHSTCHRCCTAVLPNFTHLVRGSRLWGSPWPAAWPL